MLLHHHATSIRRPSLMLFGGIMKQSAKPLNMLIISASSQRPLTASQGTFKMLSGVGGGLGCPQHVLNHQRVESFG